MSNSEEEAQRLIEQLVAVNFIEQQAVHITQLEMERAELEARERALREEIVALQKQTAAVATRLSAATRSARVHGLLEAASICRRRQERADQRAIGSPDRTWLMRAFEAHACADEIRQSAEALSLPGSLPDGGE